MCNRYHRFLASGDSYHSLAYNYRVGVSTISQIIPETCSAIWEALQPEYLPQPTEEKWRSIEGRFAQRWNFPNCCGCLDGKHVVIQAPSNSGSLYYNYKGSFSVVLLALADSNYCFTAVDIGAFGRSSDGGIFANSTLAKALDSNQLNFPADKVLPGSENEEPMPHVLLGDEAFPLKRYLMRPYPGKDLDDSRRIFNYRLCRARRIVENAFAILTTRWRIFRRPITISPNNVNAVIKAACVLHNYLQQEEITPPTQHECPSAPLHGETLTPLTPRGSHGSKEALEVRENFRRYFNTQGAVEWQRKACYLE
ncbi:uncharacterized protein [Diadema antillarum]|uniref:uncharacterized protein n=1 Tax=Diadema antillarum TaxID=105358 RepID=UPI003A8999AA